MRWLSSTLLVLSLAGRLPGQTPPEQPDRATQVDRIFDLWNKTGSPGCALAVMQEGRIVYKHGYGMADLDHDVVITPSTVFHVASVSKQFTAASIVLLAQSGKLSLDDEVRKYVAELPDFGQRITLRNLIHHTSGLRDQWELLGLAGWRYSLDLITDEDVLSQVARQRDLNFPPGERYLYCNTGYTLLAQIVKRVSGQSLREFTSSRIFEPLGMKNTHFRDDHAEIVKGVAYGYVPDGNSFRMSVTNFDTVGATSLLTTVEDLALWDENFYRPQVGGKAMIEEMLQRGQLNSGESIPYAYGLQHGKYKGLTTVSHGGSDAGYRSDFLRFPEQNFSVVCLCNVSINPGQLTRQVADIYLANDLKAEPSATVGSEVTLSEAQLAPKAGLYHNPDGDGIRRVFLQSGSLRLAAGSRNTELKPLGEDRFRPEGQSFEIRFEPPGGPTARLVEVSGNSSGSSVFQRVEEVHPSPAELEAYVGSYRSDEIEPVYRIALQNGKLVLDRLKSKTAPLEPAIKDLFTTSLGTLHFTRDAQGKVTGFVLNGGRVLNFRFHRANP